MNIFVTAKPGARLTKVVEVDSTHFRISVHAPAHEGKANTGIIDALADHLDIPKSRIRLVRGEKSKQKVFEIIK
ncbi:MAG: DUF167 domain-containing protein [Patescibacteria group bacterium]|jgi:hypothetical protein